MCNNAIITKGTKILFKNSESERNWQREIKTGQYSTKIINFVQRWAEKMQENFVENKFNPAIAEKTSYEVDTDGISGLDYVTAIKILSEYWIFGKELKNWNYEKTLMAGSKLES